MSRITKMKYVTAETKFDYTLPTPDQTICTIVKPLGNNTHMVRTPEGEEFIVSMPPKFRRHVYVKRGSFVVTEPIVEGKKVKAEIVRILQRPQIKYFNDNGAWPEVFSDTVYLDNKHVLSEDTSDRGFVHGYNILLIDTPGNLKAKESSPTNNSSSSSASSDELSTDGVQRISSSPPESVAIEILSSASETSEASANSDDVTDSDTDDESDLVPNYNRKAVSRYVFSDDDSDSSISSGDVEDDSSSGDDTSDTD